MIQFLNGEISGESPKKKKNSKDYYLRRNYVVMHTGGGPDYLISRKVYDEARDEDGEVDLMKIKL
jgi:hypothetical protein